MVDHLQDPLNRRITYLRLSVTDRCNLRCRYCMPAGGADFCDAGDLLSRSEINALARAAVGLGIRKIRVTGGEPLVRPDIVALLGDLAGVPGLERLAVTTNGARLADLAADLMAAGVHGVNVSIDSLDADRYRDITRGGDLQRCLDGIDAALAAGLVTKLNVVMMAGVNEDEVHRFVELSRTRPVSVRFIEFMPTAGNQHDRSLTVPSADLLGRIRALTPLEPVRVPDRLALAGPARDFRVPGAVGTVGVISPVTCHFCDDCNRIRVTANGLARGCLFHEDGLDLKPWLRPVDDGGLVWALRRVVAGKPAGHRLDQDDGPDTMAMSRVGG